MTESNQNCAEIARKSEQLWLSRFSEGDTNNKVAEHLSLSASTISKFKSPDQALHLANVCEMLAFLGLKIVPVHEQFIAADRLQALIHFADAGFEAVKGGGA